MDYPAPWSRMLAGIRRPWRQSQRGGLALARNRICSQHRFVGGLVMLNCGRAFAAVALGCIPLVSTAGSPASPVSGEVLSRLADTEFNHGEVLETLEYLADRIGGRMTNSP